MLDLDKIQVGESSTDTDSAGGLSFTDASSVDVSGIIATWLARRGYSEAGYSELDRPLGGKLRNIDNMCRALHALKLSKSRLVILPDFDMDGIMSGVVGYAGLSQLGFDVELFTPDPTKGYGFNAEEADRLVREHRGVGAVITCDTGIGCVSGVRRFKELGIPVLVTDHHTENPNSSVRDMATVVVDPCAADETYPLREICGAFVFWMVLSRYAEMYLPSECEHIDVLRVFAGIGTVSDMMPLCHENRQVVRDAVSVCRLLLDLGDSYVDYVGGVKAYKSALSGLGACLRILDERHKFTKRTELTEETFGFYLSPIFNSVKRLGGDMALPFSVFSSLDLDTAGREQVFSSIVALNERRKSAVEDAMAQVEESVRSGRQPLAPYVYVCSSSTPAGVLGLVAGKFCERNYGPVVAVRPMPDGSYAGSGRSPSWYPCLTRSRNTSGRIAGHEGAFGASFKDKYALREWVDFVRDDADAYRKEFERKVAAGEVVVAPPYDITVDDAGGDVGFDPELLLSLVEAFDDYRPFGQGFSEPKVRLSFDLESRREARGMKPDGHGGYAHGKFELPSGIVGLCFGQGNAVMASPLGHHIVVGKLAINRFAGRETVQVQGQLDPVGVE